MTSWSRLVLVHHLLAFGMLSIWPASSVAQHVPPVAEEMAKTYGLDSFDPAFLNDQYWLLLPLHVAWDGADVTDEGKDVAKWQGYRKAGPLLISTEDA